jgi:hypothetical protein
MQIIMIVMQAFAVGVFQFDMSVVGIFGNSETPAGFNGAEAAD